MKKLIIAGLVLVAALVFVTIALPLLISSETVRSSLLERAREITGREMVFRGDPGVSFSPFLGIEIHDVEFRSGHSSPEPILTMPTLRGRLSIASALSGRVEFEEFQFIRPVFELGIDKDGVSSWAFPEGDMWQVLQAARQVRDETETGKAPDISRIPEARLGRFTVLDGIINYRDERNGDSETVSNFNGSLIWPDTRAPWSLQGEGIWRGDTVTARLTTAMPIMLMAGGSSLVTASINSEPLKLSFSGEANRLADFYFSGQLEATSPSLRRTLNFLGGNAGTGANFSDFTASGKISGTFHDMQLQEANLVLDDNQYSGSLRMSRSEDGGNRLNGTLAAQEINAAPYLGSLGTVDGIRSLFQILDGSEVDIRLSSKSVGMGDLTVSDFAGGLISRKDGFKLDIGNANIGNGIIVGNFTAARPDDQIAVGAEINASGINPSTISGFETLSSVRPVGVSNISVKLSSQAGGNEQFETNLGGSITMTMKSGVLTGLDFGELRQSVESDAVSGENIQIGDTQKRTPVKDFILNASINHGVAWVGESSFLIEEFKSSISGKADLRSGNLAIWGLLQKPNENGDLLSHSQYFLGGTLSQPLFVPQFRGRADIPEPAEVEEAVNGNSGGTN